MAESRKQNRRSEGPARKSPSTNRTPQPKAKPKPPAAAEPLDALTPDALRRVWELHHPDRPDVRASLERLFRQSG